MRGMSAPASKRIERIPIGLAEGGQGRPARLALVPCRSQYQRPAGRVKLARLTAHRAIAHSHGDPACRVNTSGSEKIFHFFSSAGLPAGIANAALWLASSESSFVTGHALVVDGGLTAGMRWSQRLEQLENLKEHFRAALSQTTVVS